MNTFKSRLSNQIKRKQFFLTPNEHYEFNVLAQGLTNAPAIFQGFMSHLIVTDRWNYIAIYLDDIDIFSHSLKDYKRHVAEILSILDAAHFKVSPPKCTIAVHQIKFLSYTITKSILRSSQNKTQTILDIPLPGTLSQENRFLGKIGYYRKFILDFARIGAPMHKATNKTCTKQHKSYWYVEEQEAFEHFKTILTIFPLFLHFSYPSVQFVLSTDDSLTRIADVLKQQTSSGLKVCYYRSRLLSDTECCYSAIERKILAICWCLNELCSYIASSFVFIETDREPLSNIHKNVHFVINVLIIDL